MKNVEKIPDQIVLRVLVGNTEQFARALAKQTTNLWNVQTVGLHSSQNFVDRRRVDLPPRLKMASEKTCHNTTNSDLQLLGKPLKKMFLVSGFQGLRHRNVHLWPARTMLGVWKRIDKNGTETPIFANLRKIWTFFRYYLR